MEWASVNAVESEIVPLQSRSLGWKRPQRADTIIALRFRFASIDHYLGPSALGGLLISRKSITSESGRYLRRASARIACALRLIKTVFVLLLVALNELLAVTALGALKD